MRELGYLSGLLRTISLVLLGCVATVLANDARADTSIGLHLDLESSCAVANDLESRIASLAELSVDDLRSRFADQRLRARLRETIAEGEDAGDRPVSWDLRILLGTERSRRELHASTCEEAFEAAAFVLALNVAPEAMANVQRPTALADGEIAPTVRLEEPVSIGETRSFSTAFSAALDVGALPEPALGGGFDLRVPVSGLGFELDLILGGTFFPENQMNVAAVPGAQLKLLPIFAHLGIQFGRSSAAQRPIFEILPWAGLEGALVFGSTSGISDPDDTLGPMGALVFGVEGTWAMDPRVRMVLGIQANLWVLRTSWVVDPLGTLFGPSLLGLRATLGFAFDWAPVVSSPARL